jgi:K+-transporting ATPase KdpF subunit
MLLDFILGGAVALFLLAYLVFALVRPERFCKRPTDANCKSSSSFRTGTRRLPLRRHSELLP